MEIVAEGMGAISILAIVYLLYVLVEGGDEE